MIEESAEERLARLERAVARSLGLLGQGYAEEAMIELSRAMARRPKPGARPLVEFSEGVSDRELEQAFASAEPETDRMLDADRVAQVAMRQADEALARELAPHEVSTAFATRTMADLLERQGDEEGASRIRTSLGGAARPASANPPGAEGSPGGRLSRQRVIATLERWLENLGGGARA